MYIQKKLPIELKRYIHSYIPYQSCVLCNKKFVFYSGKKHLILFFVLFFVIQRILFSH